MKYNLKEINGFEIIDFLNQVDINTYEYGFERATEGMRQIKEYVDLGDSDSPTIINKGYLIVIDGRRSGIDPKVASISLTNGMYYANDELVIDISNQHHLTHSNIEAPIRMFAEPICI